MSWRDLIAKAITDLVTPAYHGTNKTFSAFKAQPVDWMLDRGLGTHVAKDPALASSFAERWMKPAQTIWQQDTMKGEPQIYPLMIPHESRFKQLPQPLVRDNWIDDVPQWKKVMHDEWAVERAMADAAYRRDPDMLERYLREARQYDPAVAQSSARTMAEGGTARTPEGDYDLPRFLGNYGGRPYNDADRALMTETARKAWQDEGYAGLRYINTSPNEAGAKGVTDPTSYIVFDPKDIRSRFAAFDPAQRNSSELLAGLAAVSALPIGALAAQDAFTMEPRP